MSREIDERVVQMKFEAGQFEKNVQTSIHSLDELKKGMDFQDAVKGFDKLDKSAKSVNISALGRAAEQVQIKFGMLEVFTLNVMNRISNAAINAGENLIKSLTIDQITPGWDKYADKTVSVATIMSATAKQFTDTGVQMEFVNEQLDKLNWFTDETSYNFVDMVNNIGKFTSNNIELDKAVTAMQGIANWAAISGANAGEASRAMYNLSQAISSGSLKLQDWMSIENANMGTAAFKELAIQMGITAGTLVKAGDKITTANGKVEVSVETFRNTLSEGWLSADVLMDTLNQYGDATNKLNEIYEEHGILTSDIVSGIEDYTDGLKTAEEVADDWGISLEETQKYLEEFSTESMQFGLKAFRAAQEAKTFADAINSVKDAVSTGWMKTFELIFGDYMQAKEFWTNLANTFYDIFATSGDVRNEILEEWSEAGGRTYFIDSIYGTLAAILSILAPIKAAWYAVFGRMTGQRLLELTKKLHNFVGNLIQTEESMAKIARVFQGIFSVLDMGKYIVTEIAKGGFTLLKRILAELNIDAGELAATIGDGLTQLNRWVKQQNIISVAFEKTGDVIIWAIQQAKDFVKAIEDFGPVKTIIEGIHATFGENFQGIGGIVKALGAIILWLWSCIQNFKLPKNLSDVKQFFVDFGKAVRENFEQIGVSFDWLDGAFERLQNGTKQTLGVVNSNVEKTQGVIAGAIGFIANLFKDVDWAGVLLAGFGTATLATLWKFTDALKGFANAFANVTGVGKSAKGAFDAIGGYFKELKKNIQANNILKISIAIAGLAVAFGLFSRLSWDEVGRGAVAIGTMAGALAALTVALSAMNKFGLNAKGTGSLMMSLGTSVALLAVALRLVPNTEDVKDRVWILVEILGAMTLAMTALSIFAKPLQISTAAFVGMAASIAILIATMKRIGEEDVASIYASLPVVAALMAVLGAVSRLMTYTKKQVTEIEGGGKTTIKNGGAFANIIGIALALQLVISAIKRLGEMDVTTAGQGIILMIPVMAGLKYLFKAASAAGKSAGQAGKMILYIAAGLAILVPVVKSLAKMNIGDIAKGGIAASLLNAAIMLPLIAFSKYSGKDAAKAGLMILEIAGALAIIQLVIKTLGKVDLPTLIKGTASVAAVIVAFSTVVKAINSKAAANVESVNVMHKLLIIIGVLGGLLLALSLLNPDGALKASLGMSAVFLALGGFLQLANGMKLPDNKSLIKILGAVSLVGVVIGILGAITDWKGALAVAAGMSLVMVALASMSQLLKGGAISRTFTEKIKTLIPFLAALGGVMAGLALITGIFTALGGDMTQVIYVTTGMSEIIIALGTMSKFMKGVKLPDKTTLESMVVLLTAIGSIVVVLGGLMAIANRYNLDISGLIYLTTAISEVLLALGASMKLLSGAKVDNSFNTSLLAMTGFIAAISIILASVVGIMNAIHADMSGMIIFATALSEVMLAFSLSATIMGKTNFQLGLAQAGAMSLLIAAIGATLGIFSTMTDPKTVLPLATGMSGVLIAVAAVARILASFPPGISSGAFEGLAIMAAIIGGMAVILAALGGINKLLPGVADLMADGASMMIQIGRGIGGFVGGIIGGFAEGISSGFPGICANLSQGMVNLLPFFDALHQIPGGILEAVGTLIAMVAAITGAQFISGLKAIPGLGQLLMLGSVTLVSDFALFGKAIKAFSDELTDVDADKVKDAADAVVALAGIESSLGKVSSIFDKLLTEDDLAKFGLRLEALGHSLNQFYISTMGLDTDALEATASVTGMLTELENNLPPKDGALTKFFGQDNLEQFGTRLESFGHSMNAFAVSISTLKTEDIEKARVAGASLAALENELAPYGGVLTGFLFGDRDLAVFGERVVAFGDALKDFSSTVSGNLDISAFLQTQVAATVLTNIESSLNTHGGVKAFWFGDSSLGSFATNLSSFGSALVGFSAQIRDLDFYNLWSALAYIKSLVGLEELDLTSNDAVKAAQTIMQDILDAVTANQSVFRDKGSEMMKWLAEGFREGTTAYQSIAIAASRNLANQIIATFQTVLKIHSPSVVMNEMGQWVVKGLADGITDSTSAEEAAKKKAQNVISAFESEMSKLTSAEKTGELEFQLWQLTEGKNASQTEIDAKQLELDTKKLADLAKTVGMRKSAMDTIEQMLGKESEEWQSAYQDYMQAQIDMYTKKQELDSAQQTVVTDDRTMMVEYAEYMKQNAEAYELLGKSQDELAQAAYEAVYGLDKEAAARKVAYDKLMKDYSEAFEVFEDGQTALDEYARKQTGWTGFETVKQTMVDTTQIIADNIESYSVSIEESVSLAAADAIKKGTGSGSAASAAATAGGFDLASDLTEALTEGTTTGIESDTGEVVDTYQTMLDEMVGNLTDPATFAGQLLGDNEVGGLIGSVASKTGDVVDTLHNTFINPSEDMKAQLQAIGKAAGQNLAAGFSQGISAKMSSVTSSIGEMVIAAKSLAPQLDEHSPSRLSAKYGAYFTQGFANGIESKLGLVDNAIDNLANMSASNLEYAYQAIDDIIQSDDNFSPVIRPVLDFDELKSQAKSIDGIVGSRRSIDLSASRMRVNGILADRASLRRQNGSESDVGETNYNFTQNNYSPKALNRVEIYRQTENQFARLKGATKK